MNKVVKSRDLDLDDILDDELAHFGVIGMKWGVRKDDDPGVSRKLNRLVDKDVKKWADAKMYYGKGAGTRRKLLKAELNKKRKDLPGYADLFDKKSQNADFAGSAKKAVSERKARDTAYRTRVSIKQFFGVTGSLTIAAASLAYSMNKPAVNKFVGQQASKLYSTIKNNAPKIKDAVDSIFKKRG